MTGAQLFSLRAPDSFDDVPWDEAACKGRSDLDWFLERSSTAKAIQGQLLRCRNVCAGCPIRLACLEYAVENQEHGIWAGTTKRERRAIVKRRAGG